MSYICRERLSESHYTDKALTYLEGELDRGGSTGHPGTWYVSSDVVGKINRMFHLSGCERSDLTAALIIKIRVVYDRIQSATIEVDDREDIVAIRCIYRGKT